MANNNETTTKFKVDISELKKAMQDAKRQISVANSEFKAASSTMDDWSKSTDGISAKLTQLSSNLKSQKTILSSLEQQYEAVVAEQGEGSAAADRLKIAINNQKATISQTEKQISNYNDELVKVAQAEAEASKSGKSVAEVLEDVGNEAEDAGDGFTTLKGTIATFAGNMLTSFVGAVKEGITSLAGLATETREYRNEMAKLETAFTTAGHSTETATKTYKDLQAVLGDEGQAVEAANHLALLTNNEKDLATWTNIATGVYATFGASLPIEGLTEAANETAKVGQVTGPLADALNWAGISEDAFNEKLAACTSEQERQELIMNTLNGVYDEAAKKYKQTNKSVMDANRANSDFNDTVAQMGAKLEPVTTAVKNGFNGLLQELVKLTGDIDMEAFTSKIEEGFTVLKDDVLPAVKEGFKWILDNKDTLIAGLAGIAAGFVAFKVASVIMAVVSAVKEFTTGLTLAEIAMKLFNATSKANIFIMIASLILTVVTALITFIATNEDARKKIGEVWDKVKAKISDFVDSVKTFFTETIPAVFKSLIDWIKKNWTTILTFLINPFAGLFKYFYENNKKFKEFVDNAIKFIKQLPSKVWTWLLNTINKVATWIKNMTTKAKEAGQSFINKVIEFIKQLPSKVWDWLVKVINKIVTWRTNLINKAKDAASSFINKIIEFVKKLPNDVAGWLTKVVTKVGEWAGKLKSKAEDAGKKLVNGIKDKLKGLPNDIKSIGSDIVTGLWNGINNKFSWLTSQIKSFASNVTSKLKSFFGIKSPSRVMRDEVGKWLPEGIAVGIDQNAKSAISAMRNLAIDTVGAARTGLQSASVGVAGGSVAGGTVNNFYQTINSPKQLNRLDVYRQTKNLLGYAGGGY